MDKHLIERFISKYNLGGSVEKVIWSSDAGKGTHTRFMSDDKNVTGEVCVKDFELEDGEYGIYDTAQLRSLLGVLESDIKIKAGKSGGRVNKLLFSDNSTNVTYVLADLENIPDVHRLHRLPDFEVTIHLDQKFIDTFIKAKGALPDVETFTLLTKGDKATIVIGYSSINTNRVSIDASADPIAEIDPISFPAKYFREILMANKEMEQGVLKISSQGLAHISFFVPGFDINYYLVKIDRQD